MAYASTAATTAEDRLSETKLAELTASIVSAYVAKNALPAADVPAFIKSVSESFHTEAEVVEPEVLQPAVSVRKSVTPETITCLVCGKRHKTLKRHLASAHNMSTEDYRRAFNLSPDYPMVAPEYAAARSDMAKRIGLGRQGKGGRGAQQGVRRKRTAKAAA